MNYDHDHGWLTILAIWLLSTQVAFATSVALSRTEYLCDQANITGVELDSFVNDAQRGLHANNNKSSVDFDDFGSLDETNKKWKRKRMNASVLNKIGVPDLSRIPFPLCEQLAFHACCENDEETNVAFHLPSIYDSDSLKLLVENVTRERFRFFASDPCVGNDTKYYLEPHNDIQDHFMFLNNGSIYMDQVRRTLLQTEFCFELDNNDTFNVAVCFEQSKGPETFFIVCLVGMFVSVLFLLATFIVYTLIPKLDNIHGHTLRGYVGSLLVGYTTLAIVKILPQEYISNFLCILLALVNHFLLLASFFWMNVICFDIWWTFRDLQSLQGSRKRRKRKRIIIYSIYAWGCASVLTGISILMHFLPDIPNHFVRPQFGVESCGIATKTGNAVYFYGPMGVTILCNIYLFVSTALKIGRHKKDTARYFKDAGSKRHNDHKQRFILYLKLFIVMGINWSMEIISWLCDDSPAFVWYLTDMTNSLQGVIIFFIFVWKDNVKQQFLKKLCCREDNILSRNSTRSTYQSPITRSTYSFSSESTRTVK